MGAIPNLSNATRITRDPFAPKSKTWLALDPGFDF
jgi:hypothetical protein